MRFEIKNKLEIRPGNVIQVPGCEPVSSLTGLALSRNMSCNASIIPVADVLRLIPGSRIVGKFTPAGQNGTGWFLELPDGPPPNVFECCRTTGDYYRIMKENARIPGSTEEVNPNRCAGPSSNPCQYRLDSRYSVPDPVLIARNDPTGGLGGVVV